jgi:uncharacterized protein (TIGR03435 family)
LKFLSLALVFALPDAVCAQVPAPAKTFEAAAVTSIPPSADGTIHTHMNSDGGLVNYSNVGLKDVLAMAYGVSKDRLAGPAWLDSERYSVSARLPAGTTQADIPEMLQTLLRDRFGLTLHHETRERPVFALVVANGGAKLQAIDSATGCDGEGDDIGHVLACRDTVARLAEALSRYAGRPVIDQTHLPGVFEMKLQWLRDAPDDPVAATLMEALPKQLGFRLEAQKAPGDFIVVDSANQVPTDN